MPADLVTLFRDQDPDKLRVSRPQKFVFLCGGVIAPNAHEKPKNLRDYLCRVRPIRSRYEIVRAECATQLYRDTSYTDLITFEEDIARIAAVVLVIAESPGSFAELGAFTSNDVIRKSLRVIIQEKYALEESFIRFGPVKRIEDDGRAYLGVYPWRSHKKGGLVVRSARSHHREITNFIENHVNSVPTSTILSRSGKDSSFYIIYWVIYVCIAISTSVLYDYVKEIIDGISDSEIKNKIYCMKLAGWIGKIPYSGKDYLYALYESDPFDYSFKEGVIDNDSLRRKIGAVKAHKATEWPPPHVRQVANGARRPVQR